MGMTKRAFNSPVELEKKLTQYLLEYKRPKFWQSFALFLGIDNGTLLDYEKREGYDRVLKRARQAIEVEVIDRLFIDRHVVGAIFYLKNNLYCKDNPEKPSEEEAKHTKKELADNIEVLVSKLGYKLVKKTKEDRKALNP